MIYDGYICKYKEAYKKMRNVSLFSIASVGLGAGIYFTYKKVKKLNEDKEYYIRYTEENPEEDYKARMDFYEAEFKRQDEEEEVKLEEAVNKFNSRRLKAEECPNCSKNPRVRVRDRKSKQNTKKSIKIDEKNYPKEDYEDYLYLEK